MDEEQKNPSEEEEVIQNPEEEQESDQPKPEDQEQVQTEEEQQEESSEEEEQSQEPEAEPEKKLSRRQELRLERLMSRIKGDEPTGKPSVEEALDYAEELEADDETLKRLKDDRDRVATENYNRGMEQSKVIQFHTRLEIDTPRVENKYPQLNSESEDFNPNLTTTINRMFLLHVGYNPGDPEKGIPESVANPGIRYGEYVDGIYELAKEMAGEQTAQTAKNLSGQASKTALRPDGSSAKKLDLTKAPQDMSKEELAAAIKATVPGM